MEALTDWPVVAWSGLVCTMFVLVLWPVSGQAESCGAVVLSPNGGLAELGRCCTRASTAQHAAAASHNFENACTHRDAFCRQSLMPFCHCWGAQVGCLVRWATACRDKAMCRLLALLPTGLCHMVLVYAAQQWSPAWVERLISPNRGLLAGGRHALPAALQLHVFCYCCQAESGLCTRPVHEAIWHLAAGRGL
jgi:hypothetical protein